MLCFYFDLNLTHQKVFFVRTFKKSEEEEKKIQIQRKFLNNFRKYKKEKEKPRTFFCSSDFLKSGGDS